MLSLFLIFPVLKLPPQHLLMSLCTKCYPTFTNLATLLLMSSTSLSNVSFETILCLNQRYSSPMSISLICCSILGRSLPIWLKKLIVLFILLSILPSNFEYRKQRQPTSWMAVPLLRVAVFE